MRSIGRPATSEIWVAWRRSSKIQQAQDAIVRTIAVIGEAASRIQKVAPAFLAAHPELPWSQMRGIRNKVVHDYFDVAWDVVWDTGKQDLPPLLEKVKSLLKSPG